MLRGQQPRLGGGVAIVKFLDVHLCSGSHKDLGKGMGLWVHIAQMDQGMKEDLGLPGKPIGRICDPHKLK